MKIQKYAILKGGKKDKVKKYMSLIAAFLWNKSKCSISTFIFDNEDVRMLSPPKIQYLPKEYSRFRKATREIVEVFFNDVIKLHKTNKKRVTIEFKIVFPTHGIPYLYPAKESKFVYNMFMNFVEESKSYKQIRVKPQLRKRLTAKNLKHFKKELRSLHLVSRKKDAGFEYHLWAVALHATSTTYQTKMKRLKNKLINAVWKADI